MELSAINFSLTKPGDALHNSAHPKKEELFVFYCEDFASAVRLTRSSSEMLDCRSAGPDELRTRAARYRTLSETLLDPRVIAVVQACARELETEAIAIQTADHSCSVIDPDQARR